MNDMYEGMNNENLKINVEFAGSVVITVSQI